VLFTTIDDLPNTLANLRRQIVRPIPRRPHVRPAGRGLDKAHEGLDARVLRARATAVPALTRMWASRWFGACRRLCRGTSSPRTRAIWACRRGLSDSRLAWVHSLAQVAASCVSRVCSCHVRRLCVRSPPRRGASDCACLTPRGAVFAPRPCARCSSCHGGPACGPGCCAAPAGAGALLLRPVREGIQGIEMINFFSVNNGF